MSLPPIAAEVTADAVAVLPGRLRGRLDTAVEQAHSWATERTGDVVTVRPDAQVVVTLTMPVRKPEDAVCSCLLAPRCLHRAAVLSAAPILTAAPIPTAEEPRAGGRDVEAKEADPRAQAGDGRVGDGQVGDGQVGDGQVGDGQVGDGQAEAAARLWQSAAVLLGAGIAGGGAVAQAELLRAAHRARALGLHAAATTAVRVVEQLRAVRREEPSARLAELTDDVRELLVACHRLGRRDAGAVGVARREYAPVGDLRLFGLFCEPVRTATGHAGAVTYLVDRDGRLWVVSDVKPAEPASVKGAVRASVQLGEVRLSHHELSRAGLRAINAYASPAGRLSHGQARQAVAAPGASWFEPPLAGLWQADPAAQADRWLAATAQPAHDRPAAHDLAFLDGTILGAGRFGLVLAEERSGRPVGVGAPVEDPALPYVTNLRLLAVHARGRPVRLVARFTGPRRVLALAVAAPWLEGHHVDLGVRTLTRADLPGPSTSGESGFRPHPDPPAPPLHLVRHLLERVVATGRPALLSGPADDARTLAAAPLTTAAALVTALGAAGTRRTRDVFGRLDPYDPHRLAVAWLTAAAYEHAAAREVIRTAWR